MKRRSKEDWQELILRQAESGISAQQFCRDNDVNGKRPINPTFLQ